MRFSFLQSNHSAVTGLHTFLFIIVRILNSRFNDDNGTDSGTKVANSWNRVNVVVGNL